MGQSHGTDGQSVSGLVPVSRVSHSRPDEPRHAHEQSARHADSSQRGRKRGREEASPSRVVAASPPWSCPTCDEMNRPSRASCNNCGQGKPAVALNAMPGTAVSSGSRLLHQSSSASAATSSADPPARPPPHSVADGGNLRRTGEDQPPADEESRLRRHVQELQDEAYARRLFLDDILTSSQTIPDEPTATRTRAALPRPPLDRLPGMASVDQQPRQGDPEPPARRRRTVRDSAAEPMANQASGVLPPTAEVRLLHSTAGARRAGLPALGHPEVERDESHASQAVRDVLQNLLQNLEEQQPRGMSQEAIEASTLTNTLERLPCSMGERSTGSTKESTQCQCMVCLENFSEGDELRTLPCFHRFHRECIDTWLGQSFTCPVCKHSLVANHSPADEFHEVD